MRAPPRAGRTLWPRSSHTTLVHICAVVKREPRNHDNGLSDVWALTAYWRWLPTPIGTRHHACAPGYRSQISYPFRGHVRGSCEFDTLFLRFPRFRYPKRDTRVTRLVAKKMPFLHVFIYADDVQAPMRHTPPGQNLESKSRHKSQNQTVEIFLFHFHLFLSVYMQNEIVNLFVFPLHITCFYHYMFFGSVMWQNL